MLRSSFLISALAIPLFCNGAFASQKMDVGAGRVQSSSSQAVQVAQNDDYEVYFDGQGNRVIVDPYTGKVIAVQPPQTRFNRRALRRQQARQYDPSASDEDRYYLDDPEDVARFRRKRLQEQRGILDPLPDGEYDSLDDLLNTFPEAPRRNGGNVYPDNVERDEPRTVRRQPIEPRSLDEASIDSSQPSESISNGDPAQPNLNTKVDPSLSLGAREDVAALQVLLDRAGASPGVIDGRFGSNVDKALTAYREITGFYLRSTDTVAITERLAETGGDAFASYTITPQDAAGPYLASVPADYSEKAKLDRMSFTSVTEALAERFHMDESYLKSLNPNVNFNRPGTIIKVANFGRLVNTSVVRVLADKRLKQVRAYDEQGKLVSAYPATIGSTDTPSPTGTHIVTRIAVNPNYTYNPGINFKQGNNDKVLTVPPGPNGPVGSIWIALDKPTYGIHGTPEPTKIGKTESHGCIRLTNWDASELAKLVKPGVSVEFIN